MPTSRVSGSAVMSACCAVKRARSSRNVSRVRAPEKTYGGGSAELLTGYKVVLLFGCASLMLSYVSVNKHSQAFSASFSRPKH